MNLTSGVAAPNAAAKWKGLLAGFSLVLVVSPVAAETPAPGPTSSASVEISVSVAPRYRLQGMDGTPDPFRTVKAPGPSFCIAGNGAAMTLPAELVIDAGAGQGDARMAMAPPPMLVTSCGAVGISGGSVQGPHPGGGARTVIVRPE